MSRRRMFIVPACVVAVLILLLLSTITAEEQSLPHFDSFWQLVGHYSKTHDMVGLSKHLHAWSDYNQRQLNPNKQKYALGPQLEQRGGFTHTTKHKLQHDMEQFEYLRNHPQLGMTGDAKTLLGETLPALYQSVIDRMEESDYDEETQYYQFQEADREILQYYNRAMFLPQFGPNVTTEDGQPVPLLNPAVDFAKHERQWFGEEGDAQPGIVVIDNLLSPQVLDKIREYLLMSTFWYESKTPRYGKYVGAYIGDGMNDQLLMAVAYELHKAMPRVMKDHAMKELWSYKYESGGDASHQSSRTGIHTHADDAAVNVNIWITPDDANLNPDSGGLVIFTAKPPDNWTFQEFNANWEFVEENLLKPTDFANVTVPYRQNRAVLFDSFLFHKTDNYQFKKGYENRRINLTILYGNREDQKDFIGGENKKKSEATTEKEEL